MLSVILFSVVAPFPVGNCDIDFFIFCHHFCIKSPQFLNLEGVQNFAEKALKWFAK
jgi:hypothetical protein